MNQGPRCRVRGNFYTRANIAGSGGHVFKQQRSSQSNHRLWNSGHCKSDKIRSFEGEGYGGVAGCLRGTQAFMLR